MERWLCAPFRTKLDRSSRILFGVPADEHNEESWTRPSWEKEEGAPSTNLMGECTHTHALEVGSEGLMSCLIGG